MRLRSRTRFPTTTVCASLPRQQGFSGRHCGAPWQTKTELDGEVVRLAWIEPKKQNALAHRTVIEINSRVVLCKMALDARSRVIVSLPKKTGSYNDGLRTASKDSFDFLAWIDSKRIRIVGDLPRERISRCRN
jgi:hypothetical protein